MFLIRPAGANQNAKLAIGGGGPLLGSAIYGMPAGAAVDPLRSHAYFSMAAADYGQKTLVGTRSWAFKADEMPIPADIDWDGVEIEMPSIAGVAVTPDMVAVALVNGGNAANPTLDGGAPTWVVGTSLTAPPVGTDDSPGEGAVAATFAVASTATQRQLAIRIQLPAGAYVAAGSGGSGIGTDANAYAYGTSEPFKQDADTSATPGTTSGWGQSFGEFPSFRIKLINLSRPVVLLGAVGDSHGQGYHGTGVGGERGPWGYAMQFWDATGPFPDVCVVNLGRSGHSTAQISSRLNAFNSQLDFGGFLRQRASINDHTAGFDVTTTIADASWAQLQADGDTIEEDGKLFIPFEGFGADGWTAGWYSRFNTHKADEIARWGANGVGVVYEAATILEADGSYQAGLAGPDLGHPTFAAQNTAGQAMAATLVDVLTAKGYL